MNEAAVKSLHEAPRIPAQLHQSWEASIRQHLEQLTDALVNESTVAMDAWLAARAGRLDRERNRLLARLSVISATLADAADAEALRDALARLVSDVQHHLQRMNDLAYDALAIDLGGSE